MSNVYGCTKILAALLLFLFLTTPTRVEADVYKCQKAGSVAYQETPCAGTDVKATQIGAPDSSHFVGCFSITQGRNSRTIEIRAEGAGIFQMIDELNPLGAGTKLKQATVEELTAFSSGLHMKVSSGLSVYLNQGGSVYTSRYGNRYVSRFVPTAQPISAGSLYGLYKGTDSQGLPVDLLFTGGGLPQVIERTSCAKF